MTSKTPSADALKDIVAENEASAPPRRNISCDADLYGQLSILSTKLGISRTKVVRALLDYYTQNTEAA